MSHGLSDDDTTKGITNKVDSFVTVVRMFDMLFDLGSELQA